MPLINLTKIITPINLKEEREKFLNNSNYNPIFRYSWGQNKPTIELKNSKSILIQAIFDQDLDLINKSTKQYFEIANFQFLEQAKNIVSKTPSNLPKFDIHDFTNEFNNAFSLLGLDYKLEIVEEEGFNFRPSIKDKKIYMSKSANFQFFDPIGEVKHELTHIIRYENGKFNKIKKSKNYLPTEEGLATLMQDISINGSTSEFQHAAEYIASNIGLNGTLRDIYNYFVNLGFNNVLAWQRASRHKFGFIDTSLPGDILKPAMYFENSQKIKQLSNDEILRLFVGKISLADVKSHSNYQGLINEDKLKDFFNL